MARRIMTDAMSDAIRATLMKITTRVVRSDNSPFRDPISVLRSLEAVHEKIPLDLPRLLKAEEAHLLNEIAQIMHHLDHSTGELRMGFRPRYALAEKAEG